MRGGFFAKKGCLPRADGGDRPGPRRRQARRQGEPLVREGHHAGRGQEVRQADTGQLPRREGHLHPHHRRRHLAGRTRSHSQPQQGRPLHKHPRQLTPHIVAHGRRDFRHGTLGEPRQPRGGQEGKRRHTARGRLQDQQGLRRIRPQLGRELHHLQPHTERLHREKPQLRTGYPDTIQEQPQDHQPRRETGRALRALQDSHAVGAHGDRLHQQPLRGGLHAQRRRTGEDSHLPLQRVHELQVGRGGQQPHSQPGHKHQGPQGQHQARHRAAACGSGRSHPRAQART